MILAFVIVPNRCWAVTANDTSERDCIALLGKLPRRRDDSEVLPVVNEIMMGRRLMFGYVDVDDDFSSLLKIPPSTADEGMECCS